MAPVELFINLSHLVPRVLADFGDVAALAQAIEGWGADGVILGEHVVRAPPREGAPRSAYPPDEPSVEPLVMLAAVSTRTSRLRLATGILVAPIRHPVIVAKAAATVDVVSGGRLDLGLGAGWMPAEFAASGTPLAERFGRLDETIRVCRALWSAGPSSFAGRWTSFDAVYAFPKPVHGTIPIWLGGRPSPATARRIARLAEGWIAADNSTLEDVSAGIAHLRQALAAAGRAPDSAGVVAPLPAPGLPGGGRAGGAPVGRTVEDEALTLARRRRDELARIGTTRVALPLAAYVSDAASLERTVRVLAER
jgi:probable F420-dependent oxidoreductase